MSTTYTVVSDRLHVILNSGRKKTFYRGDPISILTSEQADRFKKLGAIATGELADAARDDAENPAVATGPNPNEVSDPAAATTPTPTGITEPQASDIVAASNGGAAPATNEEPATPAPVAPTPSDIVAQANSGADVGAKRPARAATVEVWRAYATDSGQMTAEQADELTKDELRDRLK